MESFLFNPLWVFIFLLGFTFRSLDMMTRLFIARSNLALYDSLQVEGTTANMIYGTLLIIALVALPVFLSACGILACFGTTTWSWNLIFTIPVSFSLWLLSSRMRDASWSG